MAELKIEVPEILKHKMAEFPEVDWSELERVAIETKLFELQLSRSAEMRRILVEAISSKSKLSEEDADKFAIELGRKIKKGRFKELKKAGLV